MTAALVVVGGGPTAQSTVRSYREAGGEGSVVVLSADDVPPYQRPPLSKDFLRGESDEDALPLETSGFWRARDVELRLGTTVTSLDTVRRTLTLQGGERIDWQRCVLATGALPVPLPVPGGDDDGVLLLRSMAQGRALRTAAERANSAVVVGSGFIGCEAAASLAMRGLDVALVTQEARPQQARLGADAGDRIAGWLRDLGVRLRTSAQVTALAPDRVTVDGAEPAHGDLVLVAGGIRPRCDLATEAGLAIANGRVAVDAHMRTSVPGVWAAGDVALAHNATAGRRLVVEHWGEALAMGEIAGVDAAGGEAAWTQAPGFWSDVGGRILKHVAWGDGYDTARLDDHGGGAFTVWYGTDGSTVGCLTHEADDDYERGRELVESGAPLPVGAPTR